MVTKIIKEKEMDEKTREREAAEWRLWISFNKNIVKIITMWAESEPRRGRAVQYL